MAMATAVANSVPPRRAAKRPGRRRGRTGWVFIAPFMLVFVATLIVPIGYAIYLSLFRDKLISGNAFVGIDNYTQLVHDEQFWVGFGRVALILVIQAPIMLLLSMIAALAIDSARLYMSSFFRLIIFLPYAVPGVVAALIWGFIYGPRFGLVGSINTAFNSSFLQPFSSTWILPAIGNIVTWEFLGYNMLIFYSALRVVPDDLYEAAALDGAGQFRIITAVKLPALRGAILVASIFSIIGSFQIFNEPNLLQSLAPNVIPTNFTPNMYAYNLSFAGQEYNYSATVAVVMGVITAIVAYVFQIRGNRNAEEA